MCSVIIVTYSDCQADRAYNHRGSWHRTDLAFGSSFLVCPNVAYVFCETFLKGNGATLEARILIKEPTEEKTRVSLTLANVFQQSIMSRNKHLKKVLETQHRNCAKGGFGPATLPSSDDFDRKGRAHLHGGGVLYITRDRKRFPSELSVFIYDNLDEAAHISSNQTAELRGNISSRCEEHVIKPSPVSCGTLLLCISEMKWNVLKQI